ncbi:MAG: hypothetical protein ABIJ47_04710 [Candidatus Bathyarchaeota archaeon]
MSDKETHEDAEFKITCLNVGEPELEDGYNIYKFEVKIPEDTFIDKKGGTRIRFQLDVEGFLENILPVLITKAIDEKNEHLFKLLLKKYSIFWLCDQIGLESIPDF